MFFEFVKSNNGSYFQKCKGHKTIPKQWCLSKDDLPHAHVHLICNCFIECVSYLLPMISSFTKDFPKLLGFGLWMDWDGSRWSLAAGRNLEEWGFTRGSLRICPNMGLTWGQLGPNWVSFEVQSVTMFRRSRSCQASWQALFGGQGLALERVKVQGWVQNRLQSHSVVEGVQYHNATVSKVQNVMRLACRACLNVMRTISRDHANGWFCLLPFVSCPQPCSNTCLKLHLLSSTHALWNAQSN